MLTLPGLIDMHVHLRDPGQTEKEDFFSGTSAALAGGFTTVLDMPNNLEPVFSEEILRRKKDRARNKTVIRLGFYFGTDGKNVEQFPLIHSQVSGLKIYLNHTTGNLLLDSSYLVNIFKAWNSSKPVLVHAEGEIIKKVCDAVRLTGQKTHICHISSKRELELIQQAKQEHLPITCGVTPHHLFLTEDQLATLGTFGQMKPALQTDVDQEYLWDNLSDIDVVESDHAPHTRQEKMSDTPYYGVPGLETTLPLLLTAVHDGKLTVGDIRRLCYESPKQILQLVGEQTLINIDPDESWVIDAKQFQTKCDWSPFDGMSIRGKIKEVIRNGEKVYADGRILVEPGSGSIL